MGRAWDEFMPKMDWSNAPPLYQAPDVMQQEQLQLGGVSLPGEFGEAATDTRNRAEDAIYDRSASRLDPRWEQSEDEKMSQLVAQGLRPGDAAYDKEMENLQRDKTDAYQQAQYGAIMGGGQEASRDFGIDRDTRGVNFNEMMRAQDFNNQQTQNMYNAQGQQYNNMFNQQSQQANYANQLRNSQIAADMQQRGFSLNEINALISGQQVGLPSMPQFNTAQQSQTPNYMGAAQNQYQGAQDQYSADQAGSQGFMSGLGTLGGLGMQAYTGGMFGPRPS